MDALMLGIKVFTRRVNIMEFLHSETLNKWQNLFIIYTWEISAKIPSLFL